MLAAITGLFLALIYFYILKGFTIISSKGSVYRGIVLNIFGFILRILLLSLVFLLLSRIYKEEIGYLFLSFLASFLLLTLTGVRMYLRTS